MMHGIFEELKRTYKKICARIEKGVLHVSDLAKAEYELYREFSRLQLAQWIIGSVGNTSHACMVKIIPISMKYNFFSASI